MKHTKKKNLKCQATWNHKTLSHYQSVKVSISTSIIKTALKPNSILKPQKPSSTDS